MPTIDLDALVRRYQELRESREQIEDEVRMIIGRLRELGPGTHATTYGVPVIITNPPRVFNVARALSFIPPELHEACRSDAYDPAKVKGKLTGEQLAIAMEPGGGQPRVIIK